MASCCPPGSLGPKAPTSLSSTESLQGHMEMITPLSPDNDDDDNAPFDLMSTDDDDLLQPMSCYCTTGSAVDADSDSTDSLWKSTNRIVIIFTDVFGIDSGNHKIFADALAKRLNNNNNTNNTNTTSTTMVVIPDIFRGHPIVNADSYIPVIIQIIYKMTIGFNPQTYDIDLIQLIIPWLQRKMNQSGNSGSNNNICCVGFCFGGWVVARALALSNESEQQQQEQNNNNNNCSKNQLLFPMKCGIGIHPALKPESMLQYGQGKLARRMGRKPVLWLSAGNDELKPGEHLVVQINAQSRNISETDVAIEFPNMLHGWVTRGNGTTNPLIAHEQERALQLTIDFIEQHCPVV